MKKNGKIEIWIVETDTGRLVKRLAKDSHNPQAYIARIISQFSGSSQHLVATDFKDFRYEKYHQ